MPQAGKEPAESREVSIEELAPPDRGRNELVSVLVSVGFVFPCVVVRGPANRDSQQTRMNTASFRCAACWCGVVQKPENRILSLARLPVPPLSHDGIIP